MDEVSEDLSDRMRAFCLARGTCLGARRLIRHQGARGVQSKGLQGGAAAGDDEELNAQPGAAGEKVGMKSTKGTKGTVGTTGSAVHKGTVDDSAAGSAASGKRY